MVKVRVLGDDHEAVGLRIFPHHVIVVGFQPNVPNVNRAGIQIRQRVYQAEGEVLIKEQTQVQSPWVRSLRSRFAAKAKLA